MLGPRMLVVDVDTGGDDAWALVALLRAAAEPLGLVRILAVLAASSGNTDMGHVTRNTLRTLQLAHAKDVPLYHGFVSKNPSNRTGWFGADGFGNVPFDWEPDSSQLQSGDGIEALHNLTNQHPGEISLLCLAPLTNLAEAMRRYPNITSNLKEVLIMGGNYSESEETSAEYNFRCDPESANIVLSRATCPVTILPWEPVARDVSFSLEWRQNTFKRAESAVIQMLNRVDESVMAMYPDEKTWVAADLTLACTIINNSVIEKTISTHARVETQGPTKGQLILDPSAKHNVKIITKLHNATAKQEIINAAKGVTSTNLKN